ncbi:PKD domain-containing protein, partial [Salinibacter ruber]|uniref:PKD domain-containing protein n=1 Tax=Salinibacter ruber TaxID=146919 RepID=UPI0020743224
MTSATLYLGDGQGGFSKANAGLTGVFRSSSSIADVDGDGSQDLLITGDAGTLDDSDPTAILYLTNQTPDASFGFDTSVPEVGETVTFDASGSSDDGSIVEYRWDFDDDGTAEATGQTASTSFSSAGDKPVTLTVEDNDGAADQTTQTVLVNAPPTASNDSDQTGENDSVTTNVLGNDTDPNNNINVSTVQVESNPSNGTATANEDGTVTYDPTDGFNGTDSYTYTVADNQGARSGEATVTITVDANASPTASFAADPTVPEVGETVTFDASGSSDPDGQVQSYEWDFDDDGQTEATGQTASTSFSSAGDKPVTLSVEDDDGATGDTTQAVTINASPTASDDSDQTGEDDPVTTVVLANDSDPDGDGLDPSTLQVERSPSNGTITEVDPQASAITYAPNSGFTGTDSYTYTVADNQGARSNEATVTITVDANSSPTASFGFDPSVPEVGETVTFDASGSSDPDGQVQSYRWDFNDDGQAEATEQTASTSFSSAGDKPVTLTVEDDDGATDETIETVSVNAPPVAEDDTDQTGEGEPVTTDVLANDTDPDGSLDASTVAVQSEPSSGTTTVNSEGTITYAPSGGFTGEDTYTYTVEDGNGAESDEATVTITVNAPPTARFAVDPTAPEVGETVTFDAGASSDPDGQVQSYRWDFNDDGQAEATGRTASTSFSSAGDKPVTLTVEDGDGAAGDTTQTVSVNAVPTAAFEATPSVPEVGQEVTLDASGSSDPDGQVQSYEWDFDDDGQAEATGQTASTSFSSAGDKPVTLTVEDGDEATGDTTQTVSVNAVPTAAFEATPSVPEV